MASQSYWDPDKKGQGDPGEDEVLSPIPMASGVDVNRGLPPSWDFDSVLGENALFEDTGKLEILCEFELHKQCLLIESELLLHRCLARLVDPPRKGSDSDADRVLACIRRTINELLMEEESQDSVPYADSDYPGGPFLLLMAGFGVHPKRARRAGRQFNGLPRPVRRAFFHVIRKGWGLKQCEEQGMGTVDTISENVRLAFTTLAAEPEAFEAGKELEVQ